MKPEQGTPALQSSSPSPSSYSAGSMSPHTFSSSYFHTSPSQLSLSNLASQSPAQPPISSPSLLFSPAKDHSTALTHTATTPPPGPNKSIPTSSSQDQLFHHARLKVHEADAEAIAEARRRILALGGDGTSPTMASGPGFDLADPMVTGDEGELASSGEVTSPVRSTHANPPLPPLPPTPLHLSGLPPLPITLPSSASRISRHPPPAPLSSRSPGRRTNPNLNLALPSPTLSATTNRGLGSGPHLSDIARRSPLSQSVTFEQEQAQGRKSKPAIRENVDYNSPHPSRATGPAPWHDSGNTRSVSTSRQGTAPVSPSGDMPKSYSQGDLVAMLQDLESRSLDLKSHGHASPEHRDRHESPSRSQHDPATFVLTQLPVPTRASSMARQAPVSGPDSDLGSPMSVDGAGSSGVGPFHMGTSRTARAYSESSVRNDGQKYGPRRSELSVAGREDSPGPSRNRSRAESVGLGIVGANVDVGSNRANENNTPDYTLAVIGAPTCGKTTLIKRAFKGWGLSEPVVLASEGDRARVSLYTTLVDTGTPARPRRVDIYEIDIRALWVPPGIVHPMRDMYAFPQGLPPFDGLVACYDSQTESSLVGLDHAVRDLHEGRAAVIVACKSDPEIDHVISPHTGTNVGSDYGIGLVQVSNRSPQGKHKMKGSFGWILKAISKDRHQQQKYKHAQQERRNVASRSVPSAAAPASPPQTPSSEVSHLSFTQYGTESELSTLSKAPQSALIRSESGHIDLPSHSSSGSSLQRSGAQQVHGMEPSRHTSAGTALDLPVIQDLGATGSATGLNDNLPDTRQGDAKPVLSVQIPPSDLPTSVFTQPRRSASDLPGLLDRLMQAIVGGGDNTFVNTFFLVYRRFTTATVVMHEIRAKWERIHAMQGLTSQYRLLAQINVLQLICDWLIAYPGDFAIEEARAACEDILHDALRHSDLASACSNLAEAYVDSIDRVDLDRSWATGNEAPRKSTPWLRPSGLTPLDDKSGGNSATYSELDDTTQEAIAGSRAFPGIHGQRRDAAEVSATSSPLLSDSQHDPGSQAHIRGGANLQSGPYTSQVLRRTHSETSRQSRRSSDGSQSLSDLTASEDRQLARSLDAFDRLQDLAIAIELSRLEWRSFAAIRPRDCLRSALGGEKDTPIADSMNHFNHISAWVSTMVLGHSKPRNRSKVFEKLLAVAKHLRRQRNYSTLHAVCAGLGDTSVRRLSQTRTLLRPGAELELQALMALMDSGAFYERYRAALGQDAQAGQMAIPFIGIITQALIKTEHGERADSDDVKWPKCTVLADAIAPMALFQARGSPVAGMPVCELARQVIMGCPTLHEEALYRRSRFLEPEAGGPTSRSFKRMMDRMDESVTSSMGGSGYMAGVI